MNGSAAMPEHLLGIVGHPLGHSMSPLLHNWGFGRTGFPGTYLRWDLPPDRIEGFMTAVRTLPILGVSVTIPYKRTVMPYLDELSDAAARVGAVNTILWSAGKLFGENTDVEGFLAPLQEQGTQPETALVLGSGGAARAVLCGLDLLGVQRVWLSARNLEKARRLAAEFGAEAIGWDQRASARPEMLINATPMGMKGRLEEFSPWPADRFPAEMGFVYDLVYNPEETALVRQALGAGLQVFGGLAMFVRQAIAQFRLWTGRRLEEHPVSEVVRSALGAQRR